jgi:hypothetical protein
MQYYGGAADAENYLPPPFRKKEGARPEPEPREDKWNETI